ncbi:SLC13 family permease [Anaeroselena agilis]|uniref:Sodium-dependent dicarboxylate transporter SdcS n=1 Tax=Anaeroselena agilis TaxID=3063788 RepID=A0ABU3P332_9FIRM|nr:DASS family sodium-coupled anion symporter [Selenomonadales bacterium 4137-cl]
METTSVPKEQLAPMAKMTEAEEKFDRRRKTIGWFLGPVLGLLVFFIPIEGLKPAGHTLMAIMTFVATWWICEPVPIPVTSLIGPVLAVLCGVTSAGAAFAPFANPLIYLFMGSFMLATGMMSHGLDKRFAYAILSMNWVGSSPTRILLAVGLVTALLSGWVSNTATTAMMYPISLGLLMAIKDMYKANGEDLDLSTYKYATGLMLMTAYAASVGGVLTPVGTPPNIIMMGFLDKLAGIKITFFQWMIWGSIAMVVYFVLMFVVLRQMFPAGISEIPGAKELITSKRKGLGPLKTGERNAIIAFALAVILWVLPGILTIFYGPGAPIIKAYGKLFPEAVVAMMAGLLLFIMPTNWEKREFTLQWKDAVKGIDWGTLILFGGGLSLGAMMYTTGLSKWIGDAIVKATGANSQVAIIAVFSVMSLLMSELTSHTAATNMVGPLGITVAMSAGLSPIPVAVAIALASSLGFMLPVSTPPNAIVYASGMIPITKMIRSGVLIDAIGLAVITIPLVIYVVQAVVK